MKVATERPRNTGQIITTPTAWQQDDMVVMEEIQTGCIPGCGKSDLELLGKGEESSRFALERAQVPQPDRRQSTRYSPTRDIACLGWWKDCNFKRYECNSRTSAWGGVRVSSGSAYHQNRKGLDLYGRAGCLAMGRC